MTRSFLTVCFSLVTITFLSFNQGFDLKASIERGKAVYEGQCITCHMAQGEGLEGVFPPLAKSGNLDDKNRFVKIVMQGLRGTVKVNGTEYNGEMTGFDLTDQQVSDVLNYVRNSWGNNGGPILPAEVRPALQAKITDYQPYK